MPIVDCPACGRKVEFAPSSRWRPFCSERCRTIDLGAWASGAYVVGGGAADETGPEDDAPPDGPPSGMFG